MIGMFAGRGDVVLMMGICLIVGLYLGYRAAKIKNPFRKPRT